MTRRGATLVRRVKFKRLHPSRDWAEEVIDRVIAELGIDAMGADFVGLEAAINSVLRDVSELEA